MLREREQVRTLLEASPARRAVSHSEPPHCPSSHPTAPKPHLRAVQINSRPRRARALAAGPKPLSRHAPQRRRDAWLERAHRAHRRGGARPARGALLLLLSAARVAERDARLTRRLARPHVRHGVELLREHRALGGRAQFDEARLQRPQSPRRRGRDGGALEPVAHRRLRIKRAVEHTRCARAACLLVGKASGCQTLLG